MPAPLLERAGVAPSIAVVARQTTPEALLSAFARGSGQGAAKGAGIGTLQGLGLALQILGAAGPYGIFVMAPIAAAVVGGVAVGGAIVGASQATREGTAAAVERLAATLARAPSPADDVARVVVDRAGRLTGFRAELASRDSKPNGAAVEGYGDLRRDGFGAAIEVGILTVAFVAEPGPEGILSLDIVAESTLVDVANGRVEQARGIVYQSAARTFADWTRDDGAVARVEFARALVSIGEAIVDDVLLRRDRWVGIDAEPRDACGPLPRQPDPKWSDVAFSRQRRPSTSSVTSRTPLLEWAPIAGPAHPDAGSVRYDLRIWDERDDLVYERLGLEQARHAVEMPLPPGATLTWSVRSRHVVGGHARATPWSALASPAMKPTPVLLKGLWYSTAATAPDRTPCFENDLQPCGCLDFLPTVNRFAFRTP